MNKIICLLAIGIFATSCAKKEQKEQRTNPASTRTELKRIPPADGKYPAMAFAETEFDFGDIKQGDKVTHIFEFTNSGEADLLISDAYGSCGCTKPKYPKEAIKPGASGEIEVTFNSAGKKGKQHKTVTVVTNTAAEREKLQIITNINLDVE